MTRRARSRVRDPWQPSVHIAREASSFETEAEAFADRPGMAKAFLEIGKTPFVEPVERSGRIDDPIARQRMTDSHEPSVPAVRATGT